MKTKINPIIGDIYITSAFMSTSLSIKKAVQFTNVKYTDIHGTMMKIVTNYPCLFLEGISPFGESEVLFPPGISLKLIDAVDDYEFIDMGFGLGREDRYNIESYKHKTFKTNFLTYEIISKHK